MLLREVTLDEKPGKTNAVDKPKTIDPATKVEKPKPGTTEAVGEVRRFDGFRIAAFSPAGRYKIW